MAWKYNMGLLMIIFVVIVWVSSAEITQSVFSEYEHPFVITYLGISLLTIYLPIASIKDQLSGICMSRLQSDHFKAEDGTASVELTQLESVTEHKYSAIVMLKEEDDQSNTSDSDDTLRTAESNKLTAKQTCFIGFLLAPLWFITEYLMNAAIARTNVTSITLLTSTSGIFTLIIGALLGEEVISFVKIISVAVSMAGVAMTILEESRSSSGSSNQGKGQKHSVIGDLFAVLYALSYGLFTVLLKKCAGEGERVDMQKLFGYMGLFNLSTLWWLVWPLTAMGLEPKFKFPQTAKTEDIILINSFVGNVVCDYFWALGVVWTSPMVAALGASLTIPIAMLEDMIMHGQQFTIIYIIGSAQVFLGFMIANLADYISQRAKSLFDVIRIYFVSDF